MIGGKPWEILHGDVRRVCQTLPENYFDAVLSDPPYGLSFMGRRWDYNVPSAFVWQSVERVMKPGAHAMIFGGTRTFHRLVTACEDGGFIPRDLLQWIYGSGFPKSTNISKEIDRTLGATRDRVRVKARNPKSIHGGTGVDGGDRPVLRRAREGDGTTMTAGDVPVTAEAQWWNGFGTALKPGYEPILLAFKFPDGTYAENALKWGTGGLAIDACRIGVSGGTAGHAYEKTGLFGMGGKATIESLNAGRWPPNVILSHTDECVLVGSRVSRENAVKTRSTGKPTTPNRAMSGSNYGPTVVGSTPRPDEEVWECAEGCPVRILDEQSGGGASRFFYTAKADTYQREAGLEGRSRAAKGTDALRDGGRTETTSGNTHPTVKPIDLIRYLATLILPPKRDTPRRILVPFCGVSSEMIGCLQAGWDEVIGIEREAEYIEIAKARITKGGVLSGLMDRKLRRRTPEEREMK